MSSPALAVAPCTDVALAEPYRAQALPPTWPDRSQWRLFGQLLLAPFRKSGIVDVPFDLPGPEVPAYARRPFHGLPNGYYSHRVAEGYDTGFELSMLGRVGPARRWLVDALRRHLAASNADWGTWGRHSVLDLGCGTGRLAGLLVEGGFGEVWGLEPSPYLLRIAAPRFPEVRFVQGVGEQAPFVNSAFQGVAACFLFHELPRDVALRCLAEVRRVLAPGGIFTLVDPCIDHIKPKSLWSLGRAHGLFALYFHLLARGVYEPYLDDWQSLGTHEKWLNEGGFELLERRVDIPFEYLVARRLPD